MTEDIPIQWAPWPKPAKVYYDKAGEPWEIRRSYNFDVFKIRPKDSKGAGRTVSGQWFAANMRETGAIIPPFLRDIFAESLHEQLKRDSESWRLRSEWGRKSHVVSTPKPSEEHIRYEYFKTAWDQLVEDGINRGYLTVEPGEGIGLNEFDPMTHAIVYDETMEEWEARKAQLPGTVTFHIHKGDQ